MHRYIIENVNYQLNLSLNTSIIIMTTTYYFVGLRFVPPKHIFFLY